VKAAGSPVVARIVRGVPSALPFVPIVLFLLPPLLTGRIFFHGDLESYFHGLRLHLRTFWLHGRVEGWNPAASCGLPLLGDIQLAAFYPPNIVFYLFDPGIAFTLSFIIHFSLGVIFFRRFLAGLGHSSRAAAFGGIVFMWSGFFWAHLHHVTFLAAAVWLPLMLDASRRWVRAPSLRSGLPLSAALGMALLAGGSPQIVYYSLLVLIPYTLVSMWRMSRPSPASGRSWSPLSHTAAFVLLLGLGMLAAAVEFVPFLLTLPHKYREPLEPLTYSSSFALHPFSIGRLLVPNLFGSDFYVLDGKGYVGPSTYWETWAYLGIVTLPLVGLGIKLGGRRDFFNWLFGLTFLGAFGTLGGVHILFAKLLPFYTAFRAPSRLFMLTGLAAGVLSARALDAMARRRSPTGCADALDDESLRMAAKFTIVLGLELWFICGLSLKMREEPVHPISLVGLGLALVNLLLAWLWLNGERKHGRNGILARVHPAAIAAVLLLIDLLPVLSTYNHTFPAERATRVPDVVRAFRPVLGHDRILSDRSAPSYLLNAGAEFGYRNVRGYNPLNPRRVVELLETADFGGRREGGISMLVTRPLNPVIPLLGARFHVTGGSRPPDRFEPIFEDPRGGIRVYRDRMALPRAFFAADVIPADSVDDAYIRTRAFAHRRPPAVVLTRGILEAHPDLHALDHSALSSAALRWQQDDPDEIRIEVETAGSLLLVLTDTFAPGWRADVDGVETDILPAFESVRAVKIPRGHHLVRWRYRAPGFTAGLLLSCCAVLVLLALWFFSRRRAPRSHHASKADGLG